MTPRRLLLGIAAAVAVVLVAGVALLLWSRRDRPVTPDDVRRAVAACRAEVQGRLVAPATFTTEDPQVFPESFRITGNVVIPDDGKGQQSRSLYICEGKRLGGGFTVSSLFLSPG